MYILLRFKTQKVLIDLMTGEIGTFFVGLLLGLTRAVGAMDSGAIGVDLDVIMLPLYLDF